MGFIETILIKEVAFADLILLPMSGIALKGRGKFELIFIRMGNQIKAGAQDGSISLKAEIGNLQPILPLLQGSNIAKLGLIEMFVLKRGTGFYAF